jgi:hypothetical protein
MCLFRRTSSGRLVGQPQSDGMIARRAFERPDVETHRARCNPRQRCACLAGGAKWPQDDHDAIASSSGGSVTELSVTGRYRGGGDGPAWNLRDPHCWSILLTFQKLMHWSKPNQTRRPPTQRRCYRNNAAWKNWRTGGCQCRATFLMLRTRPQAFFDASGFVCEDDTDAIIRATVLAIGVSLDKPEDDPERRIAIINDAGREIGNVPQLTIIPN